MSAPVPFDPHATLVPLQKDGRAVPVAWTPDVFRRLATGDGNHVVGAKHGVEPADFHADDWEVHPAGDEVLYLLAGALDVVLDEPDGERTVRLQAGQSHRGTRHRPVGAGSTHG